MRGRPKRAWLRVIIAIPFCCCLAPVACFESYVVERYEIVEHPTKNVQATMFFSNTGAMDSGGFHIVIGIKGATPYWRIDQVGFSGGSLPKLTWIGDTLQIEVSASSRIVYSLDEVTTLNGHTINIEIYKDGELVQTAP